MDEQILSSYYQEIADKANDIIPVEWYQLAMYVEDVGNVRSLYMYFKEEMNGEYIYSGNIPDIYQINEDEYYDREDELLDVCRNLRKEFISQGAEPWNILKFYLKSSGELNIEFGYEYDEKIDDSIRALVWRYQELGIKPDGVYEENRLYEYVDRETGELKQKI